ncbi:MAG: trypsin-like peptidase domain-containing protein [Candidatus Bathyarchaeota archaeon]
MEQKSETKLSTRVVVVLVAVALMIGVFIGYSISWTALDSRIESLSEEVEDLSENISNLQDTAERKMANMVYENVVESIVSISTDVSDGSGFIFSKEGHIITNYHVLEFTESGSVIVVFMDGTEVRGEFVAADPYSDLAVLRVDLPEWVNPLLVGDSSKIKVGEPVIAIGNPLGLSSSVSAGIVSQTSRSIINDYNTLPDLIQFDAAVNPGSSGGPLLNYDGEVIGVVTRSSAEGIGFAISSNFMKKVVQSLLETGEYKHTYMGITGRTLDLETAEFLNLDTTKGVLITRVVENSPAESAGISVNDVIIQMGNVQIKDFQSLVAFAEENSPGDTVNILVLRNGGKLTLTLTFGESSLSAYSMYYANVKINILDEETATVGISYRSSVTWPLVKNAPNWGIILNKNSEFMNELLGLSELEVLSNEVSENVFWSDEYWDSDGSWQVTYKIDLAEYPNWQKSGDEFTLTIHDPWKPDGFLDAVNITSANMQIVSYDYSPDSATDVTEGSVQEGYLLWLNTSYEESPETYAVTFKA